MKFFLYLCFLIVSPIMLQSCNPGKLVVDIPTAASTEDQNPQKEILNNVPDNFFIKDTDSLRVNKNPWPLRIISYHLDRFHPGFVNELRIQVQGGNYPYYFYSTDPLPDGMTLDHSKGIIRWNPQDQQIGIHNITINVIDQSKDKIKFDHAIEVTKNGYVFISDEDGEDTVGRNGGIEQPYKSIAYGVTRNPSGISPVYVFRAGTYSLNLNLTAPMRLLMAYPGETVIIDGNGGNIIQIRTALEGALVQGFELRNTHGNYGFMINLDSRNISKAVFRKNKMHSMNVGTASNNQSFIFTWDQSSYQTPGSHYKEIIFQENEISNEDYMATSAAGAVLYDVANSIFEDNYIHHLGGICLMDKDDGYFNTFRNNECRRTKFGIKLINQYSQLDMNVHHNLLSEIETSEGILIGAQTGFLKDFYIHHNTLVNSTIALSWVIGSNDDRYNSLGVLQPKSGNVNLYRNVFHQTTAPSTVYCPIGGESGTTINHYLQEDRIKSDGNLFANTYDCALWSGRRSLSILQNLGLEQNSERNTTLIFNPKFKTSEEFRKFGY